MSTPDLRAATVEQLRSIHALKSAALSMFDPMLARVAAERDDPAPIPRPPSSSAA